MVLHVRQTHFGRYSSLRFGLFQEFGPFLLTEESYATAEYRATGVPTPIFNRDR